MSTSIRLPESGQECHFCGSRIFDHDPICVRDCMDACGSPIYFCNHACLVAHIDAADLTAGDSCEWSP